MNQHQDFMERAMRLALASVEQGTGPFGCLIVKDGEVIATGHNCVTARNDSTAHAEVVAIRNAETLLHIFCLKGCVMYTSCEPCAMCYGAIRWAQLDAVYYTNLSHQAAEVGFPADVEIFRELKKPKSRRRLPLRRIMVPDPLAAFRAWTAKPDKILY